jgi:ADP-ribose pyrophosphatase
MKKKFETVSSKVVYDNPRVQLRVDKVKRPNGNIFDQAYFVKPDQSSVGIIAVENSSVYLVQQYRHAARQWMWQIPMGTSREQTPLLCAKEELKQETGLEADKWKKLGSIRPEPGMLTQPTDIFLASNLKKRAQHVEDEEFEINVKKFPFTELESMISTGAITCGYTMSAWLLYRLSQSNHESSAW